MVREGEKGATVMVESDLDAIDGFEELHVDASDYINTPRGA